MNPKEEQRNAPDLVVVTDYLQSPVITKFMYGVYGAIFLAIFASWVIGPIIIEQAYYGKSLSFINTLIEDRGGQTLSKNIVGFYRIMTLATVFILWLVILIAHTVWGIKGSSENRADEKNDGFRSDNVWLFTATLYSVLILASIYIIVVFHGNSYVSMYVHDSFIYYDGSYRLDMGQVPHKDFHTPLGLAGYLVPYWGLVLKETYAGSLELASFLVSVVVTVLAILLLKGRSSVLFAILTVAYLGLMVAVPMNVGTDGTVITHAMYYNRWAWAILTLVLITYISPNIFSRGRLGFESLLVGILIALLFFLKITFFIVAFLFLFVLASASRRQRYLAIIAGGIALVIWAVVEWQYSITLRYFQDIWMAIESSGAVRPRLFDNVADNIMEVMLVLISVGVLIARKAVRWSDLLFVTFVFVAGFALLNQNKQSANIVVFLSILLWTYSVASRSRERSELPPSTMGNGDVRIMWILLVLFIVPPLLSGMRGMTSLTIGLATSGERAEVAMLPGLYIGQKFSSLSKVHSGADPVSLFKDLRRRRASHPLSQGEYIETVSSGVRLLEAHEANSGKIMTLDMANPFNFLIGVPPPEGDYSWFHVGRVISKKSHVAAATLLRDVDHVMIPLFPILPGTSRALWELYGAYIETEYQLLAKEKWWTLYERSK